MPMAASLNVAMCLEVGGAKVLSDTMVPTLSQEGGALDVLMLLYLLALTILDRHKGGASGQARGVVAYSELPSQ